MEAKEAKGWTRSHPQHTGRGLPSCLIAWRPCCSRCLSPETPTGWTLRLSCFPGYGPRVTTPERAQEGPGWDTSSLQPLRQPPWLAQTLAVCLLLCDRGRLPGIPNFLPLGTRRLPGLQGGVCGAGMGPSQWAGGGNGLLVGELRTVGADLRGAGPRALVGLGLWLQVFLLAFLVERNLELGF